MTTQHNTTLHTASSSARLFELDLVHGDVLVLQAVDVCDNVGALDVHQHKGGHVCAVTKEREGKCGGV